MKLIRHFRIITIFACMLGVWKMDISTPVIRHAYQFYFTVYKTCLCLQLLSQIAQAFIASKDENWVELFSCLSVFFPHLIGALKLNLFHSGHIQDLLTRISKQEDRILSSPSGQIRRIYLMYVKRANRSYFWNIAMGVSALILYCGYPKVPVYPGDDEVYSNTTVKYMPISTYMVMDKYKHIKLAVAIQIVGVGVGSLLYITMDSIFYGLLIYLKGQIKILNYFFNNIYEYGKYIEVRDNVDSETAQLMITKDCIVMYQQIIREVATVNKMLRNFMVCSFLLSTFKLPIIITLIMQNPVFLSIETISILTYLTFEVIGLYYNYWYANEIRIQSSEGIVDSIIQSHWYLCSRSVRKALTFTMLRSTRPCTINIGQFGVASLTSMIKILKAGYGYLSLINNIGK